MANDLIQIITLFGIPTIMVVLFVLVIILIIALFFYFKRRQKVDALKVLFEEMVELAKVNYDPHMLHLFRLDMPPMIDYLHTINEYMTTLSQQVEVKKGRKKDAQLEKEKKALEECKNLQEILKDYNSRIGKNKRGVYKGAIVGFNKINLYSNFQEMYQPEEDGLGYKMVLEEGGREYRISNEEYNDVSEMFSKCGGFLNVVVYEIIWGWKIPFIWRNKLTKAILCFDDQLIGTESDDGILTLLTAGTESHGFYFEIASGYPDRTKVILTAIKSLTWIRSMTQTQSNIFELVNNSLNMNPTLLQTLAVKQMERPVPKPAKTE